MRAVLSWHVGVKPNRGRAALWAVASTGFAVLAWKIAEKYVSRSPNASVGSNAATNEPPVVVYNLDGMPDPPLDPNNGDTVTDLSENDQKWASELVAASFAGEIAEVSRLLDRLPSGTEHHIEKLVNVDASLLATRWVNLTTVGAATLGGRETVLQRLVEARADVDARCQHVTCWDGAFTLTRRDTPLCIAAKEGNTRCAQLLLDSGAAVNAQSESEYFEGAVEWGEDDDGTETMYYSALDVATSERNETLVAFLKSKGGTKIAQPSNRPRRKMISSGSRMGA